ncbi:hypothetical protein TcYC6_0117170 [Trypanosoma cruzi]|uniref:Uncharacterized protein n=2 Tax=Trypanosoma cruzi TaxID=5693 RepID=Q4DPE8_TRYCC|nr:hypothetical protein, conserved [Trypanosoma cruzi]EAN94400.1 hypothetical protein, conserved [Trypanosoma cruzi]KAF5219449.1 hypothetical protein ECC02_007592 [Trypanosoma cruzi]KAF8292597.1 hypothetical protein TcYC6_0117170 [Trypanosoma cruzi]|eukprot:XP_816251.1 hypothetical protein [Trypanosoma cruzi strain CL Brener]
MAIELVVDAACERLYEVINIALRKMLLDARCLHAREDYNIIPSTVFVNNDSKTFLLLLLIKFDDWMLMVRHNCVCNYLKAVYDASNCPVYVVILGQLTGHRQSRFWEEVSCLCADDSFFSILVGFDIVSSVEQLAEVAVAHGLKATKQQNLEGDPIVRAEGRRKCDPTDFHALYLDMLLEISSVSERRASTIAGTFPSMFHLLEFIDSGAHNRVQAEEYYEKRATSVLDPYIAEVLSTDYYTTEAQEMMNGLFDASAGIFS